MLFLLTNAACTRHFQMKGGNFSAFNANPNIQGAALLHRFNEGIYVAQFCKEPEVVDGVALQRYVCCPDSSLYSEAVLQTAYFVFMDDHRLIYRTRVPLFNAGTRSHAIPELNEDLDSNHDKNRTLLRGYYNITLLGGDSTMMLEASLEAHKGACIYFNMLFYDGMLEVKQYRYDQEFEFISTNQRGTEDNITSLFKNGLFFKYFPLGYTAEYRLDKKNLDRIEFDASAGKRVYHFGDGSTREETLGNISTW